LYSNVPTADDILVPETLLKKRKTDADATAKAAAQKVELRKVIILFLKII
jgi:large subunit ribosomal protein L7e